MLSILFLFGSVTYGDETAEFRASNAGCAECQKAESRHASLPEHVYDQETSCLKKLGPEALLVFDCMDDFYKRFMAGEIPANQVSSKSASCAGLVRDKALQGVALSAATLRLEDRLREDLKKNPALKDKIAGVLASQARARELAIFRKHTAVLKSAGMGLNPDGSADFSKFDFSRLKDESGPVYKAFVFAVQSDQVAKAVRQLYFGRPGEYHQAVTLGDIVITPNYDHLGKPRTLNPKIVSVQDYTNETSALYKELETNAYKYVAASREYNSTWDLTKRILRGGKPGQSEQDMITYGNRMTQNQLQLVHRYGLDRERLLFVNDKVLKAAKSASGNIDESIKQLDKVEIGTVVVPAAIAGVAAAAATGGAGAAAVPVFVGGMAAIVGLNLGEAFATAATSAANKQGSFLCNLGEQLAEKSVDTALATPFAAAVAIVGPAAGVPAAVMKHLGVQVGFAALQAPQAISAGFAGHGDFKSERELEQDGHQAAAQAARARGWKHTVDAVAPVAMVGLMNPFGAEAGAGKTVAAAETNVAAGNGKVIPFPKPAPQNLAPLAEPANMPLKATGTDGAVAAYGPAQPGTGQPNPGAGAAGPKIVAASRSMNPGTSSTSARGKASTSSGAGQDVFVEGSYEQIKKGPSGSTDGRGGGKSASESKQDLFSPEVVDEIKKAKSKSADGNKSKPRLQIVNSSKLNQPVVELQASLDATPKFPHRIGIFVKTEAGDHLLVGDYDMMGHDGLALKLQSQFLKIEHMYWAGELEFAKDAKGVWKISKINDTSGFMHKTFQGPKSENPSQTLKDFLLKKSPDLIDANAEVMKFDPAAQHLDPYLNGLDVNIRHDLKTDMSIIELSAAKESTHPGEGFKNFNAVKQSVGRLESAARYLEHKDFMSNMTPEDHEFLQRLSKAKSWDDFKSENGYIEHLQDIVHKFRVVNQKMSFRARDIEHFTFGPQR